jgi:hypothetical protein
MKRLAIVGSLALALSGCGLADLQQGVEDANKQYEDYCKDAAMLPPGFTPQQFEELRDQNCPKRK